MLRYICSWYFNTFTLKKIRLQTLISILYYSIFNYPLTKSEIHQYSNNALLTDTNSDLNYLLAKKIIYLIDGFYVFGADYNCVPRRRLGNAAADVVIKKAQSRAYFISKFPFVECVGISGSLSKNYYDENSDIDFFVITKRNRLWLCRLFLVVYKKIFLFNSYKQFCINYYITANCLEIEEKNRFTATEITTLIPITGKSIFSEFYNSNLWVLNYFVKFTANVDTVMSIKKTRISNAVEYILDNKMGNYFDLLIKRFFIKQWQSKFNYLTDYDYKIALKSTTNVSKHHPLNFQKKVLDALQIKLDEVRIKFNLDLEQKNV